MNAGVGYSRKRLLLAVVLGLWSFASCAVAAEVTRHFHIERQLLTSALNEFARQSDREILFSSEVASDKRTGGVSGVLAPEAALRALLQGKGLSFRLTADQMILIGRFGDAASVPRPESSTRHAGAGGPAGESTGIRPQAVVVTGSRIRGAQPSSPVVTVTLEEMQLAGHHDLGEVIRALPLNFGGGQNPGVDVGASAFNWSNGNVTGSSSLNLRGLGPDATLTLLNGMRLPYDGEAQAIDVSSIPTAAIERLEILLDGASAIYGTDAVGGVANVILKRDYQGAELSARYGAATGGGDSQTQFSGIAGHTWVSGGFLIASDISRNSAVRAGQREYLDYLDANVTIHPATTQKGALFSGHQQLGGLAELTLDAFYTDRRQRAVLRNSSPYFLSYDPDSVIWSVAPAVHFELPNAWSLQLHAVSGRNRSDSSLIAWLPTGMPLVESPTSRFNRMEAAGVDTEGPLFAGPGGVARLSMGAGYRSNELQQRVPLLAGASDIDGSDSSYFGYAEIHLPLVSEEQRVPFVSGFSINAALRHEDYESFGATATPKVGARWSVVPGFDLKASWGESFKTPMLSRQFAPAQLYLYSPADLGGTSASTSDAVLMPIGRNPRLDPERARIVTAGFVARPQFLPGFSVEVGWFDLDHTSRVVLPFDPSDRPLGNPVLAEFVTLNPTPEQRSAAFAAMGLPLGSISVNLVGLPYEAANIVAIVDDRYVNAARSHTSGVDLAASYATDAFGGHLSLSMHANWIDAWRQRTRLSPKQAASGVVFFPPRFQGRFGASWSRQALTLAGYLNHIGAVTNTHAMPAAKGGTMTTADLSIAYRIDSDLLGDVSFNLAAKNVFGRRPPFMQPTLDRYVNYDSTNYSALGRVVSATVTKRF